MSTRRCSRAPACWLAGGTRLAELGEQFFTTLLADVPQDAAVMQEESFGPLLPATPVDSDEEAVARMNDSRFRLAGFNLDNGHGAGGVGRPNASRRAPSLGPRRLHRSRTSLDRLERRAVSGQPCRGTASTR